MGGDQALANARDEAAKEERPNHPSAIDESPNSQPHPPARLPSREQEEQGDLLRHHGRGLAMGP
jgi:hypothetical protein